MTLIEEAARRLEQLEKAGIEPGSVTPKAGAGREPMQPPSPPPAQMAGSPKDRAKESMICRIDVESLAANGLVCPSAPDSKLLHELRIIKRPLIQNARGKSAGAPRNANLIMVTSSLPGEGKSFVAVNLAISMAMEVDSRVLLVDADVVAPSIPTILGLPAARGLMDVLLQPGLDVGDVLLKTNIERLGVMPAGSPHARAAERLASDAMAKLLVELSTRYPDRIVVFDSPPLLATTESRSLAAHMGQVVVVVEAGRTTEGDLESALLTVKACPIVFTVLNKSVRKQPAGYYGSYAASH